MKLEDVKRVAKKERRTCRANLRLYPSQMKFIDDNDSSVQLIFDKALEELGHKAPNPEDIEKIADLYRERKSRGRGRSEKGDVRTKKRRTRRH